MQLHQGFPRKLFLPNCDDDAPVSPVDNDMLDFIEKSAIRHLQLLQASVRNPYRYKATVNEVVINFGSRTLLRAVPYQ